MKRSSDMSPISAVFMIITVSPYIGMKFGLTPMLIFAPLLVLFGFSSYQFYLKRSKEKNISYIKALEEDLPDMSPIHFLFFFIIAIPIFLIFTGGNIISLAGIGLLYLIYFIYYYGFRSR
jgi:hypothetical protein